jgi:hypothetical protein
MTTSTERVRKFRKRQVAANADIEFCQLVKFIVSNKGLSNASFAAENGKLKEDKGLTPRLVDLLKASTGLQEISHTALRLKAAQHPIC